MVVILELNHDEFITMVFYCIKKLINEVVEAFFRVRAMKYCFACSMNGISFQAVDSTSVCFNYKAPLILSIGPNMFKYFNLHYDNSLSGNELVIHNKSRIT